MKPLNAPLSQHATRGTNQSPFQFPRGRNDMVANSTNNDFAGMLVVPEQIQVPRL
jgi:hypothetical protein